MSTAANHSNAQTFDDDNALRGYRPRLTSITPMRRAAEVRSSLKSRRPAAIGRGRFI